MEEIVGRALHERHEPARGQEPEPERHEQDQHDAQPEVRDGDAHQADGERRAVGQSAPVAAAQQAEGHADQRGADGGEERELDGDGEPVEDHPADRLVLSEVQAKVAPRDPGEPGEVLAREGLVQMEFLAEGADRLRGGLVAEDGDGGIAGDEPHEPEHEHAHPEEQRHGQGEPAGRIDPGRRHQTPSATQPSPCRSKRAPQLELRPSPPVGRGMKRGACFHPSPPSRGRGQGEGAARRDNLFHE
jgi:hypothetical protein